MVIYDTLPRAAQEFCRLSDLELHHWARVPDEQDHDALAQTGCESGVECHAHSYKLERADGGGFKHLTGSAPTWLGRTPMEMRSYVQEGQFDVAREMFVKAFSHAAVDISTPWHVTRELTSTQHSMGEKDIAKKLRGLLPANPAEVAMPLAEPRSLYQSAVAQAEATYRFVDRLKVVQADGGHVYDDADLAKEIVANALGFGISVAAYCWHWVSAL